MFKIITVAAISAMALTASLTPQPAQARGGAIAAGVIGGVAAGAIIGSAAANSGYYNGPGYYDGGGYAYQPVYGACHIERQQFDDGYGRIRIRRVRVCD
ncbi:MAG TPA: hypothetical protein VGC38_03610 [Pseudolabrys sp.]